MRVHGVPCRRTAARKFGSRTRGRAVRRPIVVCTRIDSTRPLRVNSSHSSRSAHHTQANSLKGNSVKSLGLQIVQLKGTVAQLEAAQSEVQTTADLATKNVAAQVHGHIHSP